MLRAMAIFITDKMIWLILAAGILGYSFSGLANSMSGLTPYLLALMVVGSGFNLVLPQLFQLENTLWVTVLALVLQLGLLPLLGYVLYQVSPEPRLAIGLIALGIAPCEITSALMTMLAKGNLALASRLMAFSIFLAAFLTPIWLEIFLNKSVTIDLGGMLVELGLIITLPFVISSILRTRFTTLAHYETEFSALSALSVILLIFVVGGSIASFTLDWGVAWLVLACLIFNLAGYGMGIALSWICHQKGPEATALIFTSGMREFGIATTVALGFLPAGAALAPAIYGIVMMLSATLVASRIRFKISNDTHELIATSEPLSIP